MFYYIKYVRFQSAPWIEFSFRHAFSLDNYLSLLSLMSSLICSRLKSLFIFVSVTTQVFHQRTKDRIVRF